MALDQSSNENLNDGTPDVVGGNTAGEGSTIVDQPIVNTQVTVTVKKITSSGSYVAAPDIDVTTYAYFGTLRSGGQTGTTNSQGKVTIPWSYPIPTEGTGGETKWGAEVTYNGKKFSDESTSKPSTLSISITSLTETATTSATVSYTFKESNGKPYTGEVTIQPSYGGTKGGTRTLQISNGKIATTNKTFSVTYSYDPTQTVSRIWQFTILQNYINDLSIDTLGLDDEMHVISPTISNAVTTGSTSGEIVFTNPLGSNMYVNVYDQDDDLMDVTNVVAKQSDIRMATASKVSTGLYDFFVCANADDTWVYSNALSEGSEYDIIATKSKYFCNNESQDEPVSITATGESDIDIKMYPYPYFYWYKNIRPAVMVNGSLQAINMKNSGTTSTIGRFINSGISSSGFTDSNYFKTQSKTAPSKVFDIVCDGYSGQSASILGVTATTGYAEDLLVELAKYDMSKTTTVTIELNNTSSTGLEIRDLDYADNDNKDKFTLKIAGMQEDIPLTCTHCERSSRLKTVQLDLEATQNVPQL